jgi:hypothetical protein
MVVEEGVRFLFFFVGFFVYRMYDTYHIKSISTRMGRNKSGRG